MIVCGAGVTQISDTLFGRTQIMGFCRIFISQIFSELFIYGRIKYEK